MTIEIPLNLLHATIRSIEHRDNQITVHRDYTDGKSLVQTFKDSDKVKEIEKNIKKVLGEYKPDHGRISLIRHKVN